MKIEKLKDYEDNYLIDELGNIVTIPSLKNTNQFSKYYTIVGKIDKNGYVRVTLTKNGVAKQYLLHRLVANQFLPNVNLLPQVNHIDGCKLNNSVSNLEWVTAKQNTQHAYTLNINGFKDRCIENINKYNAKTKYVYVEVEKEGIINVFSSTNEASIFVGCCRDKIAECIKHNRKIKGFVVRGHKAQFANEEA